MQAETLDYLDWTWKLVEQLLDGAAQLRIMRNMAPPNLSSGLEHESKKAW